MNDYRRPITADELIRQYDLNSLKKTKTTIYNQIKDLSSGLQSTNVNLQNFVNATTSDIENLQEQIDGNITTWFYNGVPTLENAPANEWDTDTKKDNHLGDLYYDQNTGYSYRFAYQNNVYSWTKLTDSDITEALALANAAQDTADSKRRVFVVQPIPPYDVGDIWTNGTDLYRCKVTRASGAFNNADWILATNYTDDSYARGVEAALNSYKTEVSTTYSTKSELTTATDEINGTVSALTTRTTTLEGEIVNKASVEQVSALSIRADGIESTVSNVSTVANNALAIANASVDSVDVLYALGTSSTTAPTSGWNTVAPAWEDGKYMWQKTVTTYGDSSTVESEPTCLTGATGATGQTGATGPAGPKGDKGDKGDDADPAIMYHNATGTSIDTEDAGNLELKSVNELSGDTTQETTTGKNIMQPRNASGSTAGITYTYDATTQTYTFNGTSTTDNNTITLSSSTMQFTQGTTTSTTYWVGGSISGYCYMRHYSSGYSKSCAYSILDLSSSNNKVSLTTATTFECPGITSIRFNNGSVANNFKIKVMVAQTTNTDYEPYTNGTSPNPDYPQPIETTTDNQKIDIKGLNEYNPNNINFIVTSGRYSKIGNGVISTTPTATDWASATPHMTTTPNVSQIKQIIDYGIPVEANEKYTLVYDNPNSCKNEALIFQYDEDYKYIQHNSIGAKTDNKRIFAITVQSNCKYVMFRFDNEDYNSGAKQFSVQNIMWLKGEYTSTNVPSYEVYSGKSYEINLGKNLFDSSTFVAGTIVGTDTTTRITSMQNLYLEKGTYTFSWNGISPYNFAIQGQTIGKPPLPTYPTFTLNSGWQSGSSYSFTITTPLWVDVCLRKNDNSTITINEISGFQYQIEKGSTRTSYSPYFEPIELCKIGTYQDKIFKGKGVNLFDNNIEQGSLSSSGTPSSSTTRCRTINFIDVLPSTTYTLSLTSSNTIQSIVYEYNGDTFLRQLSSNWSNVPYTFTTGDTTTKIKLVFRTSGNATIVPSDFSQVQLEKGNTNTDFEPYGAKDKWLLHKEIGKVVLDGSEDWGYNSGNAVFVLSDYIDYLRSGFIPYSNYYKGADVNNYSQMLDNEISCLRSTSNNRLIIKNTSLLNASSYLKAWLQSNPTSVYYVLATPTTTEITNSELIKDLDEFEHAVLNEGINHIIVDGNLPIYLDIDYWTYYKGEPGLGIKTVQEQYYLSTSSTTLENGSWEETCPTWVSGRYIWTRSHITWADDSETDTTPTLANGINTANQTANDASESVDETNQNVSNLSSRTGALEADIINKVDNADFNDYKEYVVSNYSTINQTSEKISIGIAEATQTLVTKDEYSTTTNQLSEVRSYFDFASDGLTIGKSTSNTTLVLTNEKLSFKLNGQEKAYMSPDSFVLKELKTFKLGGFAFKVRANGNLALVWVGEQE